MADAPPSTGIKRRILAALQPTGFSGPYWLLRFSPLRTDGWLRSVRTNRSVDANGRPMPWITYPAIDFLSPRLNRTLSAFEWGSGGSTQWLAERVRIVDSCEHDPAWFERVRAGLPANCTLVHRPLEDGNRYAEAIGETGHAYDLVVIDGRQRVECSTACLTRLSPGGVVVWDNTDREEYAAGLRALAGQGFHRVDFWGLAPMLVYTVLFRPGNCLGI